MGHWPDGVGPFDHLFLELKSLNYLWTGAFGEALFKSVDRPRDFGWILRPSQREWDEFIVQLDKLLSDNIVTMHSTRQAPLRRTRTTRTWARCLGLLCS
jgi:hypothetical protein